MSRKYKLIASYLFLPLLFVVVSCFLANFAGKPLWNMTEASLRKIVIDGAPDFSAEYEPFMWENAEEGAKKTGEVEVPSYGTRYGELICEKVSLKTPLYYGDDDDILLKGAGQYIGSSIPGKGGTILVGGHDTTFFSPLENIAVGDIITVMTTYGKYDYEVTECKIVDTNDNTAYDLEQKQEQLILYTCYPFGEVEKNREKRYFIYCKVKE